MTLSKKGFELVKPADVTNQLIKFRDNYKDKGKYLGFDRLDPHYTMMLGTCTDWTGFPRSGKTQILMELLLNTSMFYDWRHLIYFPDVGSKIEIIADLLHKKTGKTFNPDYPNVIQDNDIYDEINWLLDHFKILTKSDVKAKLTPFEFFDMAVELKKTQSIQTACIDSWKDLSHPYNEYGGYATYLEVVLPYRNQIAEDNNLHIHTVIHPKLTEKVNGKRVAPTPYDLKGGSEWFNSGKCMITVHRESTDTTIADIIVNKVKPRSCGSVGQISLEFDLKRFVYFEHGASGSVYASPKDEIKIKQAENIPKQLKPLQNNEFDIDFEKDNNDIPF